MKVTAVVDASKTGTPISPHIYGQFLENLGDIINGSLWAEMLDDRKFFYPVDSSETLTPVNTRKMNRRRPVGPDEAVVMVAADAYSGEHSPLIRLDGASPRGIRQAGLALRKGKGYTGRVVLAGDPLVRVRVSLIWRPGEGGSQTLEVGPVDGKFAKYPLAFTSGGDTDDGSLEITATGTGTFRVGAASLMPSDNIQGMRPDALQLLNWIRFRVRNGTPVQPGGPFPS